MNFKTFLVFNADNYQYIVNAPSWVRAVQAALTAHPESIDRDWTVQDLTDYNPTIRQRLINESIKLDIDHRCL